MKRLHIHIKTKDLNRSVAFYAAMFDKQPDRLEADYAKWLLDDPVANISLSTHGGAPGVDHVGVSFETREEMEEMAGRLSASKVDLAPQEGTTCCYAQSNKYWAKDPQGAVWELFHSFGDSAVYGAEPDRPEPAADQEIRHKGQASCCAPS
ncbi:MAG: ArsI/CadI family heavy metal resistance metalloenzyme [Hyphococcus sp.]